MQNRCEGAAFEGQLAATQRQGCEDRRAEGISSAPYPLFPYRDKPVRWKFGWQNGAGKRWPSKHVSTYPAARRNQTPGTSARSMSPRGPFGTVVPSSLTPARLRQATSRLLSHPI